MEVIEQALSLSYVNRVCTIYLGGTSFLVFVRLCDRQGVRARCFRLRSLCATPRYKVLGRLFPPPVSCPLVQAP